MTLTFFAVLLARNPIIALILLCVFVFLPVAVLCEIIARADYYADKAKEKERRP